MKCQPRFTDHTHTDRSPQQKSKFHFVVQLHQKTK